MADYLKDTYCRARCGALALADRLGLGKAAEIAACVPDLAYTLAMLLRDGRVPKYAKLKLGIAAAYMAMPLDALPLAGLDDAYVGMVALAGVMDDIGGDVLAEYWPGDTEQLLRFKSLMSSLNESFGAGAIRRLGKKLGISVEVKLPVKFSLLPYSRPDFEGAGRFYTGAAERLKSASSFEEADGVFLEVEKYAAGLDTLCTIANIRHDIDTRDEFYDAEVAYIDEHAPELEKYSKAFTAAMLASPFRPQFEAKYNRMMFVNAQLEVRAFSPEIVPELQRENALTTEYSKLLASAQIPFEGKTYTLSQLTPIKEDSDPARRAAAWKAEDTWYSANAERLDAIYGELVALRTQMGRKLGYGDFIPLGYDRMTRNCYTKEDVARFRAAVREYIVPIAYRVYETVAKRLGESLPMGYAGCAMWFADGNARPSGTAEDILDAGRRFYHELSGETAEFIDFMLDNEMMDVLSKPGKAGGGYCTNLPEYSSPFIFANFNGTSGDVEVITHEAGHAFAAYLARDIIPAASRWPTLEACEVHSMSMEFFAEHWAESFFGADADKFRWQHLADALTFIPYGTLVDHFQHECYEHPELTPAGRNERWLELQRVYMPWLTPEDGLEFYSSGRAWQRQRHIYIDPFYYIDYCLAQTVSLEFWAMLRRGRDEAWDKYMAYTRPAGTLSFRELLRQAGLGDPFEGDTLKSVAEEAARWLDGHNS